MPEDTLRSDPAVMWERFQEPPTDPATSPGLDPITETDEESELSDINDEDHNIRHRDPDFRAFVKTRAFWKEHNITLRSFLRGWIQYPNVKRSKRISTLLSTLDEEDIANVLSPYMDDQKDFTTVKAYQKRLHIEIDSLVGRPGFGKLDNKEDYFEATVLQNCLEEGARGLDQTCPLWFELFSSIVIPKLAQQESYRRKSKIARDGYKVGGDLRKRMFVIMAIITHIYSAKSSTQFAHSLAIFLNASQVHQSVIDSFNHLGLSIGYKVVNQMFTDRAEAKRVCYNIFPSDRFN